MLDYSNKVMKHIYLHIQLATDQITDNSVSVFSFPSLSPVRGKRDLLVLPYAYAVWMPRTLTSKQ